MKLFKQRRCKRALERFTIQTEAQWNKGNKPNKTVSGSYEDYVARKQVERASLEVSTANMEI